MNKDIWNKALPYESDFWTRWAAGKGKVEIYDWSEDYKFRTDPDAVMQQKIIDLAPNKMDIDILDVGAGPLTVLGKKYPGKNISITAVDPMAQEYDNILEKFNIIPPVRTILCEAERLDEHFTSKKFDIIYCQNALDHSYDPFLAIKKMLDVLKPDGSIMLFHENNEGENEGYRNLHQWNFCSEKGSFIIWQPGSVKINVTKELYDRALVHIHSDSSHNTVVITKL